VTDYPITPELAARVAALEQLALLVNPESLSGLTTDARTAAVTAQKVERDVAALDERIEARFEGVIDQLASQAEQLNAINALLVRIASATLPVPAARAVAQE
jgi:hypothetical protein